MFAIFEVVGILYTFHANFLENKSRSEKTNIPGLSAHHGVSLSER